MDHLREGWRKVAAKNMDEAGLTVTAGSSKLVSTSAYADTHSLGPIYERVRNEVFPLLSDSALSSRDRWKDGGEGMGWPNAYLSEASSGPAYQALQRILAEGGFPDTVTMVRDKLDWKAVGLNGVPQYTNASLWEGWLGRSTPNRAIFSIPRSHIVGFGSFGEDEVFVRTDSLSRVSSTKLPNEELSSIPAAKVTKATGQGEFDTYNVTLGNIIIGKIERKVTSTSAMLFWANPAFGISPRRLFGARGDAVAWLVEDALAHPRASAAVARWMERNANVPKKRAAKVRFIDFERGTRVHLIGKPEYPGTVVGIRGQGNAYTKGYLIISFDYDPDRHATYPWREVEVIEGKS